MENVVSTVVPVFVLIMLGYGASRAGLFVEGSARGLSTFVFSFAVPALLFNAMVQLGIPAHPPWALWFVFFGAVASVWVLAILLSRSMPELSGAGGASAAMGAGFGNTVMLGLPIGFAHFGNSAVLPMALIISIHLPLQWFAATLLAQWSGKSQGEPYRQVIKRLFADLLTNPIVLALLLGSAWNLGGMGLHPIAEKVISMLAQAAIPAALFALGLSLARFGFSHSGPAAFMLMVLKLAVLPLIVWLLANYVFQLSQVETGIAVLFAALPTGANAYIFAERQGVGEAALSACVAIGTAVSLVSLSIVLSFLPQG